MSAATRLSDETSGVCDIKAECCPHGRNGANTTCSGDVIINGRGAHRQGDNGSCRCPHGGTYSSVGASATVFVNGRGLTRVGDETVCQSCGQSGSHSSGSDNVFAG